MILVSLAVATAGVRGVLGRFLDLDDIYPTCVGTCAPSTPFIEGCFQNESVELMTCALGACERGWMDAYARCVNCLNANTPELDYKTYQSRTLGLDQLVTACKLLNGNGMNETVTSWEDLTDTVKTTVIASKTRLPNAATNLNSPLSAQSGIETSGTIGTEQPSTVASSESPVSGGGTPNLGRIISRAVRDVLGGALGGAAALALAVGVIVWLFMRKRKRSPVRTDAGFETDSAPPYPDGATHPPIAPSAEKHLPPNYPSYSYSSSYPTSSHYPPPRTARTLVNAHFTDAPRRQLPPLPQVPPYQPLPAYKVETLRALHPLRPVSPPESPQTTQSQDAGRIARSPLSPGGPRREVPPPYDPRWNDEEDGPPPYGLPPGAMAPYQGSYQA